MPGRAPLRGVLGTLGAWLLGGFWVWALGSLCGLGAAVPPAGTWGNPAAQRPCQAPQQWEGRQVLYQQSSGRNSRALLSYDGLNQRVRVLDERKALIPCKRYARHGLGGRRGRVWGGLGGCAGALDSSCSRRPPPTKEKLHREDPSGIDSTVEGGWRAGPTEGGLSAGPH